MKRINSSRAENLQQIEDDSDSWHHNFERLLDWMTERGTQLQTGQSRKKGSQNTYMDRNLANWVSQQKKLALAGKLTRERKDLFESVHESFEHAALFGADEGGEEFVAPRKSRKVSTKRQWGRGRRRRRKLSDEDADSEYDPDQDEATADAYDNAPATSIRDGLRPPWHTFVRRSSRTCRSHRHPPLVDSPPSPATGRHVAALPRRDEAETRQDVAHPRTRAMRSPMLGAERQHEVGTSQVKKRKNSARSDGGVNKEEVGQSEKVVRRRWAGGEGSTTEEGQLITPAEKIPTRRAAPQLPLVKRRRTATHAGQECPDDQQRKEDQNRGGGTERHGDPRGPSSRSSNQGKGHMPAAGGEAEDEEAEDEEDEEGHMEQLRRLSSLVLYIEAAVDWVHG